jgi:hypothetical protein
MGNCYSRDNYDNMKVKYGPELERARQRAGGFKLDKIEDASMTGFLTKLEYQLPLCDIDILEFERRLKKMVSSDSNDLITQKQLIESFRDHAFLCSITEEDSLLRLMLFSPTFE